MQKTTVPIVKTESTVANDKKNKATPSQPTPDHIVFARHDGGDWLILRFADNYLARINLKQVGIRTDLLRLPTAVESQWGNAVEVKDRRGRTVPVDSSMLRSACDPEYAANLQEAFDTAYAEAVSELQKPSPAASENARIRYFPAEKQRRLDILTAKKSDGTLSRNEYGEKLTCVRMDENRMKPMEERLNDDQESV